MIYNKQVKKEREFSNMSSLLDKSHIRHLSNITVGAVKNNFFLTENEPKNQTKTFMNLKNANLNESKETFNQEQFKDKDVSKSKPKKKENAMSSWVEYFAYYKQNGSIYTITRIDSIESRRLCR